MNIILSWLAQNTLIVACLAPLVWWLCRVLRHRPAEQHLLWLLLLVKLLTPPVLSVPVSLPDWSQWKPAPRATSEPALFAAGDAVKAESFAGIHLRSPELLDAPAVVTSDAQLAAAPAQAFSETRAVPSQPAIRGEDRNIVDVQFVLVPLVFAVWAVGCVVATAYAVRRVFTLWRVVRCAEPAPKALDALVEKQAARLGVGAIRARVLASNHGPFVACLVRPYLLWPKHMLEPTELQHGSAIIAHELAHIRRRDHFVLWLELAANCLWWWNPVFWLIRRSLHNTREMACDAMALHGIDAARRDYAEMLLRISAAEKSHVYAAPAFGAGKLFCGSLQRRLEMVFNERASGSVSAAGWLLALATAFVALPHWSTAQETPVVATAEQGADTPTVPSAPQAPSAPTAEAVPPVAADGPSAGAAPTSTPLPEQGPHSPESRMLQQFTIEGGGKVSLHLMANGTLLVQVVQGDKVSQQQLDLRTILDAPVSSARATSVAPAAAPSGLRASVTPPASAAARITIPGPPQLAIVQRREVQTPADLTTRLETARPSQRVQNIELLRLDCNLAEINVRKKRVKLEELQRRMREGSGDVGHGDIELAELELQEAELQRRRCDLLLEAEERSADEPARVSR